MWERLTAPDKTVFKTPLFWISFWVPVVLSIIIFCLIAISDGLTLSIMGGSEAYTLMAQRMKVPLVVLSLSIPLSGLVISNHRSMQLVKTIKGQERKRTYDLYYDHQKEFCITLGRIIETENWEYVQKEDLPLIHRSVFRHNVDSLNDNFPPNMLAIESLNNLLEKSKEYLKQQSILIREGIATDDFDSVTENVWNTFEVIQSNINRLRGYVTVRPLLGDVKYKTMLKALAEIDILKGWVSDKSQGHFKLVFDDQELSELLHNISKYLGFSVEDLNKNCLIGSLHIRNVKKTSF